MKVRVTKKSIRESYNNNIICVPYCALQHLLTFSEELYYTTRVEGWGCDIYIVRSSTGMRYALTTGYAPFGNIKPSSALCKRFDDKAWEMYNQRYDSNKDIRASFELLIQNFVDATIAECTPTSTR